MTAFTLGPWEPLDNNGAICRRDAHGHMGAAVYPPDARGGWGWFVLAPNGRGDNDRATSKALAQAAADAAVVEMGGNAP